MVFPTDYDINKEIPSTVAEIDFSTPLEGTGSLRTHLTTIPPMFERLSIQNNTYSTGLTVGRMRAVVQIDVAVSSSPMFVGFSCMQNSPTVHQVTDEGYQVGVTIGAGFTPTNLIIGKYGNGLTSTPTLLSSSPTTVLAGIPFVLQMDWITTVLVSGVRLRSYIGLATTDFNDLTLIGEVDDMTFPYTTSVAESLVAGTFETSVSHDLDVKWDLLSIFSLV